MWEMTNSTVTVEDELNTLRTGVNFIFPCGKQQYDPDMVFISSFSLLFFLSYDSENSRDDSDSRQDDQMVS